MKKTMFFLAAGAMALTACTESEILEEGVQSNAIGFQNMVSKESRALTKESLNKFYVSGYYTKNTNAVNVFSDELVTLADGTWGYTNTRYWVPEGTYYFYAYSCENGALKNGSTSMDLSGDATTVAQRALNLEEYICNDQYQEDLIFASNEGIVAKEKAVGNAKVAFTFKHILSKVNAVFDSEFAPGYDIKVSNVRITNIYDKANYNPYGSPVWGSTVRTKAESESNPGTLVRLAVPEANIASAADPNVETSEELKVTTGSAFVIPNAYGSANVKMRFHIEVIDHDTNQTVLERDMVGSWKPNWVAGTSYTYNITISGDVADLEPIVFETQENMNVDDWTTGNTGSVEMNFSAN
ncbi:MAG: fimbrillin family protein [Muribaculaceae bacterium]|nr:fimbrillin family protein [Muribaculaceae bacterium]